MNTEIEITSAPIDPNEALLHFLDRYCSSEVAPGYAVMLRGPWGSGKTWFVDKYRSRLVDVLKKRSLYVSLFGVSKPSDIADQFFSQIHPKLANPTVQKTWGIAKSLLKGTLKLDFDGDNNEDASLQIGIPDLGKWASTEGAVLIFDDLERVGMPIDDMLGYINQFVEHDGYRVIVIANEAKAIELAPGFPTIKEKVIGRTFEIQPNAPAAVDHFFSEISDSGALTVLESRRADVLKIFARAEYGNLRQLRQAIFDFSYFWRCIQTVGLSERNVFVDRLLDDVLTLSIEHRAGTLSLEDIRGLGVQDWSKVFNDEEKAGTERPLSGTEQALKRHGLDNQPMLALLPETYVEYFTHGHLLKEVAANCVRNSPYLADEDTPSWKRLWYLRTLSDSDFKLLSADVYAKFVALQYFKEGELLHVVGLLLHLATVGLMAKSTRQMQSLAQRILIRLAKGNKLDTDLGGGHSDSWSVGDGAYGLGFTGSNSAPFREFVASYCKQLHLARKRKVILQSKGWFDLLAVDADSWAKHLVPEQTGENLFSDEPVLASISANKFCERLLQLPTPSLVTVQRTFRDRYEYVSENSKWKLDELPFLKQTLAILLRRMSVKQRGSPRLSRHALQNWFVPALKEAVLVLEKFESTMQVDSKIS